jgi:hypothetical protein
LFERATQQGGWQRAGGLLREWQKLGPQTKALMFPNASLRTALDRFFLGSSLVKAPFNTSGSGLVMSTLAALQHPAFAVKGFGFGKLLFTPGGIRLLTGIMDDPPQTAADLAKVRAQAEKIVGPPEEPPEGPVAPPGGGPPVNPPGAPSGSAGTGAAPEGEQPAGSLYQKLQDTGDAALDRIRKRGGFSGERPAALPILDMKDMTIWAASRIGQGIVDPVALRKEIVNQFGKVLRAALMEISGRAHDLELKNVKLWRPGMPLDDIHPLIPETIPKAGKQLEKEDIIRYLNKQVQDRLGPIDLVNAPDNVKLKRMLNLGRKELQDQLSKPDPKLDFYLVDTPQADADMIQMFPELGTDSSKMTLMKAASAALAQGSNPEAEAMNGGRAYAYYTKHGRLPEVQPDDGVPGSTPGAQWSTTSGSDPIIKLQKFIDMSKTREDPTGLKGLQRLLTGRFKVSYLKQFNQSIAGAADDIVPGALILGPKIGSYFLDIAGIPQDGATVDMWDSLAQYRRLGNMFAPDRVLPDGSVVKGKPYTAPRQPDRPVFMDLHRRLENEFGLIRTQSQSGLWHYEKDLYGRLGVQTLVKGRSDGTQRLLDAWGHQRQTVITPRTP